MSTVPRGVVEGEIVDDATIPKLRMPRGVPLGVGILGVAKYTAIRLVMEECERGERAAARLLEAQQAKIHAAVRLEVAKEQLTHLDTIRDAARLDILRAQQQAELAHKIAAENLRTFAARAAIEALKQEADQLEQEIRIAKLKAQKDGLGVVEAQSATDRRHAEFMERLALVPQAHAAAARVKAEIVKAAGGEDELSPAERDLCDALDAMLQGHVADPEAYG